jgi:DNA-binding transcriptional ArsR family regulator
MKKLKPFLWRELSPMMRLVLLALDNKVSRTISIPVRICELSLMTKYSESAIRRVLHSLEELGAIQIVEFPGFPNEYRINPNFKFWE